VTGQPVKRKVERKPHQGLEIGPDIEKCRYHPEKGPSGWRKPDNWQTNNQPCIKKETTSQEKGSESGLAQIEGTG